MPCIALKYIDNPEIKVYTWYPFIKSSIEDLIDKMKNKFDMDLTPPIPPLPILKDKTKIDVRYTVVAPYSTIHIF
ncbi:MAG: hypothetical protein ACTSSP_10490, partial [Candidatus Asgardarchaeia archaeon]